MREHNIPMRGLGSLPALLRPLLFIPYGIILFVIIYIITLGEPVMSDHADLCEAFGQNVGDPEAIDNIIDIIHEHSVNEREPTDEELTEIEAENEQLSS
jgi:hypothetical protein